MIVLFLTFVLVATSTSECLRGRRAFGVYAHDTRVLVRVDYDYDGDGAIDVRTYMRNGRPVRLEGDTNGDGVVDRWEYYGSSGELLRVGGSTGGDGGQDVWVRVSGDERHVDTSTRRDGVVDRREVYRGTVLVRAETDTNHDGLPDTWEEFENGALKRLLLDEHRRSGRPTRQVVYGRAGQAHVEALAEGGGSVFR